MSRRRIYRALLRVVAVTVAVAVAASCAAPGSGTTDMLTAPNVLGNCHLEDAPLCLAGCGQIIEVASPRCEAGSWSCAAGIDDRICCDTEVAPEACPTWERDCSNDPDSGQCPTGYTCVRSRTYPTPSSSGVCRLGDLNVPDQMSQCSVADATPAEFLPWMDVGPVKLQGLVVFDTMCETNTCTAENICCNDCYGSYRIVLDGGRPGLERETVALHTATIACVGTNCGISCTPIQPGRRYAVWGTYLPSELEGDVGQLYYVGSCPL